MKIISWNVNGLRACVTKGFEKFFMESDADIFCIQETKLQDGDIELSLKGYEQFWSHADKKGYSGTAVFTKKKPESVSEGMGIDVHDHEGRMLTLDYGDYYLINVYSPNSQEELRRLQYRMQWEDDLRQYAGRLKSEKPVIICGDLNVAHKEIDLKNPDTNHKNAGFTDEERQKFTQLLESGFIDAFRYLYPDATEMYSYWSYRFGARGRNAGWRIDYTCVEESLREKIKEAKLHTSVLGSDHCPIELSIF